MQCNGNNNRFGIASPSTGSIKDAGQRKTLFHYGIGPEVLRYDVGT